MGGRSLAHRVCLLPLEYWQYRQDYEERHAMPWSVWQCSLASCKLPATHEIAHAYTNGRRPTERARCFKHALAFARKHKLVIEPFLPRSSWRKRIRIPPAEAVTA